MTVFHIVSYSGGKDSSATLLLALDRFGKDRVIPVFMDTGNEHDLTYEHLDQIERELGVTIKRLKNDFSGEIARKREFIARDQRTRRQYTRRPMMRAGLPVYRKRSDGTLAIDEDGKPIPRMRKQGGKRVRWSNKAKRRALAVLHPTGNPFLDLCLWKGRFPSRKAQFCTEHLKRNMAVEFQLSRLSGFPCGTYGVRP